MFHSKNSAFSLRCYQATAQPCSSNVFPSQICCQVHGWQAFQVNEKRYVWVVTLHVQMEIHLQMQTP